MLTLMIIICVTAAFLLIKFSERCETCTGESAMEIFGIILSLVSVICIIAWCICFIELITSRTIDEQIEMYTIENQSIESRIEDTVNSYMKYEQNTYEKMKVEDPVAVVAAYPELNSSSIVQEQIQVYNENNKKIKELKSRKIDINMNKFLVYFGR